MELVYSWRGRGGAGVQLEREGWSWCTAVRGGGGAGVQLERGGGAGVP